jgi:hypothetical protein
MADKNNLQQTTQGTNNNFSKGLNKDSDTSFVQEGMWTHAINAVNNTVEGNIGTLSNESSNYLCGTAGSTMPLIAVRKYIIGVIYLYSDKWVVFTAGHNINGQPVMSEIGLLEEEKCSYRPIVQDACLNLDKRYLIFGASREAEDCSWQVYWADGLNPDRFLNVGDPSLWPGPDYTWLGGGASSMNFYSNGTVIDFLWPGVQWNQKCTPINNNTPCENCVNVNSLNCSAIRLARLMKTPCINLKLGTQGGTLLNGTYFVIIAYSIKGQRVTDYFSPSNYQFVFSPSDFQGSLDLEISVDNENFDEFILVVVSNIDQGTVAKQLGIYSTSITTLSIDQINPSLVNVPLTQLQIQTPVYETSDQIAEVNNYLLRVGPRSKFDFNYQPLANLIQTRWVSVEYPSTYYLKGGNKTNYLRDEVYSFFIRWIYDTGDKTASYHIPGRVASTFIIPTTGVQVSETDPIVDINNIATDDRVFEVYNTATQLSTNFANVPGATLNANGQWVLDDGGILLSMGEMGYWESTEKYPNNNDEVWNASAHCWTTALSGGVPINPVTGSPIPSPAYDLCGLPIRHHKFPEDFLHNNSSANTMHFTPDISNGTTSSKLGIRLMGVVFENIILPKDNDGNDIPDIVGYEILRGSRESNKTILAKGMLNNTRTYKIYGNAANGRTGLYPNYPFNTIKPFGHSSNNNDHNFDYNDPYMYQPGAPGNNNVYDQGVLTDILTFHSPDTMFRSPYLSTTELKIYGNLRGSSTQQFVEPNQHPNFKLLSDAVVPILFIAGMLEFIIASVGKRTINQPDIGNVLQQLAAGNTNPLQIAATAALTTLPTPLTSPISVYNSFINSYYSGGFLSSAFSDVFSGWIGGWNSTSFEAAQTLLINAINGTTAASGIMPLTVQGTIELPDYVYLPTPLRLLGGVNKFSFYFAEGVDVALKVLYASIPFDQYALQMIAHGFYSNMRKTTPGELYRFKIDNQFFLRNNIQDIPTYSNNLFTPPTPATYTINNLKRSDTISIRVRTGPYYNPAKPEGVTRGPSFITETPGGTDYSDQSLVTLGSLLSEVDANGLPSYFPQGSLPNFKNNVNQEFSLPIASHYGALKVRVRNQYGQLDSIKQIVVTTCEEKLENYTIAATGPVVCQGKNYNYKQIIGTQVYFNGDTYINRYTEKNTMLFFYDWLFGQPNGFEYNYFLKFMVPQARFWVNSKAFDTNDLGPTNWNNPTPGTGWLPTKFYNLDYFVDGPLSFTPQYYKYINDNTVGGYPGFFRARNAYFYLANSSVRDFFVESDVLVDFRKQGDYDWEKHYDTNNYTNLNAMFNMDPQVISRGNIYIYDYSMSVSKLYNQYFSSGNLQNRNYDPYTSELCYVYLPDRIIYSLPQQNESYKDSWFVYLVNNYRDFKSQISGVKSINKSGIFITFKNDSPQMFQGLDQLQTDLGTKLTIGDGGLFSQPPQNATIADKQYEYGSSQNKLGIISCPAGIFYISQNQGKIINYTQGISEISQAGMKWWFNLFLPYKLTEDFPEYPWTDNPVAGIGCQSMYDNMNTILYFSKKDYKLKESLKGQVTYVPLRNDKSGDFFTINGKPGTRYLIGDSRVFDDASWTISYDPKNQFWISFHDWHPDLAIPTKTTFLTSKGNTLWKHNMLCNNFCEYYGKTYPFEIEIPINTGLSVTTVKSIEYYLECYRRQTSNCVDQFQVLDFNFDKAVIFNSEQVSGYLNLNIFPKNNITLSLDYPKLNANLNSFDILFSKEEQKYRFNQFWDITKDRGEFPDGSNYPPTGPLIPGTTQLLGNYVTENVWVTGPDGYNRVLNQTNLDYTKSELQRKKFRHYLNFLTLRRNVSGDVNMIVKASNSKNQISPR